MNIADNLETVSRLYLEYLTEVANLLGKRNIFEGIFGIGNVIGKNPCHERFAEALRQQLEQMASEALSPDEMTAVIEFIYTAPVTMECHSSARWMLEAVHGLTLPVLNLLPCEQAKALLVQYEEIYPSLSRMPVHKEVRKQLQMRAEGC